MPEIHLLDQLTANQIAAGEVIERPVSVVKELVENSLDAGSTKIVVEINNGGLSLIKVIDNGCGMSEEDLLLAVKRHATSKIRQITDLNRVQTLGFRGEALPSITSVAKVEIISRQIENDSGKKLIINNPEDTQCATVGAQVGTSFLVKELFYNTPARKKFLRSEGYESGLIHELLMKFSLSHPLVTFCLRRDDKEILNTAGMNTIPDLIEHYWGSTARNALIEVTGELPGGKIMGFLTLPTYHRMNRKGINFFVNRRRVYAKELMDALEDAYRDTLPKGQFPLCILNLELDASTIDVNVHPSKMEVRLRNPELGCEMSRLIQKFLIEQKTIPHYFTEMGSVQPNKQRFDVASSFHRDTILQMGPQPKCPDKQAEFIFQPTSVAVHNLAEEESPYTKIVPVHPEQPLSEGIPKTLIQTPISQLKIIGQLYDTFILGEGEEGLYLIDQHIAHERVVFENLLAKSEHDSIDSQVLLQPLPLHLSLLEEEIVLKYIFPLVDLGIILEHFGPKTYLLRAIPSLIRLEPQDYFYSLLEHLEKSGGKTDVSDIKKEFLIHTSCQSAIKANTRLTKQQMEGLVQDLSKTKNYLTCPHGRPIIFKISQQEILKAFQRR